MTEIDWSQFEKAGEYNNWKPENVGDSIAGIITAIRIANLPAMGDTPARNLPQLSINVEGDIFDVLLSQQQLLRQVAAQQVAVGDYISIEFTHVEQLSGVKKMKHFTVEVTKAEPMSADDVI